MSILSPGALVVRKGLLVGRIRRMRSPWGSFRTLGTRLVAMLRWRHLVVLLLLPLSLYGLLELLHDDGQCLDLLDHNVKLL